MVTEISSVPWARGIVVIVEFTNFVGCSFMHLQTGPGSLLDLSTRVHLLLVVFGSILVGSFMCLQTGRGF